MNGYSIPTGFGGHIITTSRTAMVVVLASIALAAWCLLSSSEDES